MKKIITTALLLIANYVIGQNYVSIEPAILSRNPSGLNFSSSDVTNPPVALASGGGTRLMWIPSRSAFRVGTVYGTTSGNYWNANYIGLFSFASGFNTQASGINSTSIGNSTTANGENSTSMGYFTTASGETSTSMGYNTRARGNYSTSIGDNSNAQAYASVAMGRYNIISGNSTTWVATDPLFVIGNGSAFASPNNALTILKNGNVGINSENPTIARFVVSANSTSPSTLAVFGDNASGVSLENNQPGIGFNGYYSGGRKALANGHIGGINMDQSNGLITIYNSGASGTAGNGIAATGRLFIDNTGKVGIGDSSPTTTLDVNGAVRCVSLTQTSDARFKKKIKPLENALSSILKINGVRYDWRREEFPEKNFSEKNQIGFIAQELEKIYPEMVLTDNEGYKSVDYTRMAPVLVEA
jgi:trimeric autotransporter adhesin